MAAEISDRKNELLLQYVFSEKEKKLANSMDVPCRNGYIKFCSTPTIDIVPKQLENRLKSFELSLFLGAQEGETNQRTPIGHPLFCLIRLAFSPPPRGENLCSHRFLNW